MYSMDQFFTERVGLGKAQYIPIIALCLVDMNDGAQLVLSSFLGPILQKQLTLSSGQVSAMTSIFYVGILIGSLCTGKFSDRYGRKPVILAGSLFQFVICCSFALVNTYFYICLVRFMYGFCFGLTIALTTTMFSQIVPIKYRGKGLLVINFCVSLGKIYSFILGGIFLKNFTEGNWKAMMLASAFPSLIVVLLVYKCMQESPRFLLATGNTQESFRILNKMMVDNGQSQPMTQEEETGLAQWAGQTFGNKPKGEIATLFNQGYIATTIALSCAWFLLNFIYYGQLIVLPFILGKEKQTLSTYMFTVLGEAPALLVSFLIVDQPSCGRKRSLTIFFFCAGVTFFIFCFKQITFVSSVSRFFMKECFQMLYPLTTESFGTLQRTTGFGFCSAMGRLGSVIMPFMVFSLMNNVGNTSVFAVFSLVAFMGSISAFRVPFDTVGSNLDSNSGQELRQLDAGLA